MKKILYVTGSRAEYGIVRRLLTMLRETPEIQLDLAVTGMHCDNAYGNTIHIIEQ
ncbi:TPA: UDP-N-acetylglucosamine 2-epimerase (hydrolyzing), partial [Escherichia coli]